MQQNQITSVSPNSTNVVLEVVSSPEREKDILELCRQVLNASPAVYYNLNGADDSTCPFCHERVYYADAHISEIKHSTNCAYLIAKDLSTNCLFGLILKKPKKNVSSGKR